MSFDFGSAFLNPTLFPSPLSPEDAACAKLPTISCVNCGLIPRADWDGVPAQALSLLERRKSIRRESKNAILFHQGDRPDHLYRLLSGVVLLRKVDHAGNGVATHMVVPGETFGFRSFVQDLPLAVTAQCASDVVLCRVPAEVARQVFSAHHALKRVFARHVAAELTQTENAVLAMIDLPVRNRLLRVFSRFARIFGHHDEQGPGCRYALPVLRSDIASLVGIARESFSRRIAGIEQEGLLSLHGNVVDIPDLARLDAAVLRDR